ncbi:outer membrane protein/peptidoglycan-associated (lipo)protein [Desulfocapsa sulfexigens DSM 10523]|uniref:Outer membrane protein/peptidoglycan-associated (Lipo)protein n=1 Tax=Desulfocapsa sulfexigens (strain DSM 10523 / SB164P1) TaxID=1167006 RepID=M1PBI1_DESSD|nr:OmpA family protein [Desulfocapsa sulfexigens]AGF77125.1 outer membrane protein/peptidoglycan-associated (lipo)protein [Desulfocapsa sulfexigens DSM 10523]
MKATISVALVQLFFILPITAALGLAADIEGSRDHPQFKRYEGSEIVKYEHRKYDSLIIPLGKATNSQTLKDSREIEGAITRLTYKIPMGRSPLEVIRNYEKELQANGFKVLFSGQKDALGSYFAEAAGYKEIKWPPNVPGLTLNSDKQIYMAAEKTEPGGSAMVTLYGVENRFWAGNLKNVEKGQTLLHVDIIESKIMEEKMVTVAAEEMAEQISASGSIALYGIYFDTDKSTIKPESTDTLEQIAKLLQDKTDLNLLVVGHTDNVGSFGYNLKLAQDRAGAVVRELGQKYGVQPDRLKPVGVSYACPVSSNRSENGRSKNRRVELVEHTP